MGPNGLRRRFPRTTKTTTPASRPTLPRTPRYDLVTSHRLNLSLTLRQQASPLVDTATSVRRTDRTPTGQSFHPVGHVALDMRFPAAEKLDLGLPETGSIWIKTLYISNALQSSGLGRAGMDAIEAMATQSPICAKTLMLDSVCKEHQTNKEFALGFYGYVPKVSPLDFIYLSSAAWLDGVNVIRWRTRSGTVDGATGVSRRCRGFTRRLTQTGSVSQRCS